MSPSGDSFYSVIKGEDLARKTDFWKAIRELPETEVVSKISGDGRRGGTSISQPWKLEALSLFA
jgi:hypothetical protein